MLVGISVNVVFSTLFRFVTYLSALCDNAVEGKNLLHSAINALFSVSISGKCDKDDQSEITEVKPSLLWSALYLQELTKVCFLSLLFCFLQEISVLVFLEFEIQVLCMFVSSFFSSVEIALGVGKLLKVELALLAFYMIV